MALVVALLSEVRLQPLHFNSSKREEEVRFSGERKGGENAAKKRCNLNTNKLYVVRKKKWIIDEVRNYLWDASD